MKPKNIELAMMGLILRLYDRERAAQIFEQCAYEPKYQEVELDAGRICKLLQNEGLSCMSIKVRDPYISSALQDAANDRRIVLVGLKAEDKTFHNHWGVLEASAGSDVRLVVFGQRSDPAYAPSGVSEVLNGEYVIVTDQVAEDRMVRLRRRTRT